MTDINDLSKENGIPANIRAVSVPVGDGAQELARVKTVRELLADSHTRAVTVDTSRKNLITTANDYVDDVTGGFQREFVWVIGADTSWGKSSLAVSVTDENIQRGHRVLIVAVEDSDQLYADRLLVRRTRVPMSVFRKHRSGQLQFTGEQQSALAQVASNAEDCPVYLDGRGKPVEWIARKVRELIKSESIDLVLCDYLQAFDNTKPQADRRNQLNYIARSLTDVIKTEGAAGIIFSQITVKDGQPTPNRHSIKDTRDVSNAAEVVALGFYAAKDEYSRDNIKIASEGERVLFIDKNKDGPPKKLFGMIWDESCACFRNVLSRENQLSEMIDHDFGALIPPEGF